MTDEEKERSESPLWIEARQALEGLDPERRELVVSAYVKAHYGLFDHRTMRSVLDKIVPLWNDYAAQRIKNGSQEYEDIITGEELWASMSINSES